MHPMYPTLLVMVSAVTREAQRAAHVPVDPSELERYTHHVLADFQRSGPSITDYLPELALKQVLALIEKRPRLA
jgi:hypothetical protein